MKSGRTSLIIAETGLIFVLCNQLFLCIPTFFFIFIKGWCKWAFFMKSSILFFLIILCSYFVLLSFIASLKEQYLHFSELEPKKMFHQTWTKALEKSGPRSGHSLSQIIIKPWISCSSSFFNSNAGPELKSSTQFMQQRSLSLTTYIASNIGKYFVSKQTQLNLAVPMYTQDILTQLLLCGFTPWLSKTI